MLLQAVWERPASEWALEWNDPFSYPGSTGILESWPAGSKLPFYEQAGFVISKNPYMRTIFACAITVNQNK